MAAARRGEIAAVYAAGLIQGVALVTFPAASAVFMDPRAYALSGTRFGAMFVPEAVLAVAASLLGAALRRRLGRRRVFLSGLAADLLAMALLLASDAVLPDRGAAYALLLAATACLGVGFGFAVPALNTYAAEFFPEKADKAVLAINAFLGLGTALAPVFVALFVGAGFWWGLPSLVGALLAGLLWFAGGLALGGQAALPAAEPGAGGIPPRFWVFAAFALLYGVCETMSGNWAVPYMTRRFAAGAPVAALALAVFWGMVTAGRVLFAGIERWAPPWLVLRALPFVLAAAFAAVACAPRAHPALGVLAFALAGLACSALLPLALSFGQAEMKAVAASAAGGIIAFYQVGYGIAAFGVGPLKDGAGLRLHVLFAGAALVALALGALSFGVARKKAPA